MMLQFNPPVPVETPKGYAWAIVLIDYTPDHDLLWVCFLEATGECWTFQNKEIRQGENATYDRKHVIDRSTQVLGESGINEIWKDEPAI